MIDVKYNNMSDTYNIVWLMNKTKSLCADVYSYINKFTLLYIPSSILYDKSTEGKVGDEVFFPFLICTG